ncbi:MAG: aminoacyl-tRNA hydrolase [Planctomycetota bacterium]
MSSLLRVLVGLGNPGSQYDRTRHNAGFEVVDRLAQRLGVHSWKNDFSGAIGEIRLEDTAKRAAGESSETRLLLVKPQTYMNLSGSCVQPLLAFYKVALKDCLVAVDDINLGPGELRLKQTGSHGGHNGLRDLQARLGTVDYPRLRIGVGRPASGDSQVGHVLGRFSPEEWTAVDGGLAAAVDLAERFARGGFGAAQKWWSQICQEQEAAERKERIRKETERRHAAEARRRKEGNQTQDGTAGA